VVGKNKSTVKEKAVINQYWDKKTGGGTVERARERSSWGAGRVKNQKQLEVNNRSRKRIFGRVQLGNRLRVQSAGGEKERLDDFTKTAQECFFANAMVAIGVGHGGKKTAQGINKKEGEEADFANTLLALEGQDERWGKHGEQKKITKGEKTKAQSTLGKRLVRKTGSGNRKGYPNK